MSDILHEDGAEGVRCPICGASNYGNIFCKHVRWRFDQGGPVDFARFAVETSPYTTRCGYRTRDLKSTWWNEHGEWVVEQVLFRFDASDGYVFGVLAELDLLARDIWREFQPQATATRG